MAQSQPQDCDVHIVVVDNDDQQSAKRIVEALPKGAYPIHYVHQPRRGIPMARNTALDKASELGADWIAFIDDDETADPQWIADLMAPHYRNTPILMGTRRWRYPNPMPFWAMPPRESSGFEGKVLTTAATYNVRFSAALLAAGIRFDENLAMTGGTDTKFFEIAMAKGFEIRRTLRAITYEFIHPERVTYYGQTYRAYVHAASRTRRTVFFRGWPQAFMGRLLSAPVNILFGACEIAVSPLFFLAGSHHFKRRAITGGIRMAKGLGWGAAIIGHHPSPYQTIDGH